MAAFNQEQIALWDGLIVGTGLGVSCHASIRIASDNTKFSMPETKIGAFSGIGCSKFLSRL